MKLLPDISSPIVKKKKGNRAEKPYRELGSIDNDKTAVREILGLTPRDQNYKSFKHDRLKELIGGIFHINLTDASKAIKEYRNCMFYLYPGKLLIYLGAISAGAPLLERSLQIARRMDFTEERIVAARLLGYYYLTRDEDNKGLLSNKDRKRMKNYFRNMICWTEKLKLLLCIGNLLSNCGCNSIISMLVATWKLSSATPAISRALSIKLFSIPVLFPEILTLPKLFNRQTNHYVPNT